MKKVLYINTVDDPDNAVASVIYNLQNNLKDYGWDSYFAVGRHCKDGKADFVIGNKIDIYSHVILSRLFDTEGRHSLLATKKFLKEISDIDFDIIHIHNLHGHYLHYPTLFSWIKKNKIPTVITLHDCWTLTGHCATYFHNNCTPPAECINCKINCDEYPKSLNISTLFNQRHNNVRLKQKYIFYNPDIHFVTVSNWLKNQIVTSGLTNNITTIYNGVDIDIFKPYIKNAHKTFNILFITNNWESWKGLDSVINFAPLIRDDEKVTLVGNVYGRKLPENIHHINRISSREGVAKLYCENDIFISPSIAETFGMTTVEAMSCGLPVIVNNSAALPEIVSHEAGIITDTSSPEKIRMAIDYIKQNYDMFSTRKYIEQHFSTAKMAQEYCKIYERIKKR